MCRLRAYHDGRDVIASARGDGDTVVKQASPQATRRLQITLLLFFGLGVISLIIVYITVPALYVRTLLLTPRSTDSHPVIVTVFLGVIVLFVSVLSVGVLRR